MSMYSNEYLRSPGSPGSVNSRDMVQSDSEGDAQGEESDDEAPLYPIEGQFTSTSDKAHILGLPEIEREEILAERAANVTRRQQDLQLKRALAATREKARNHNKRKADTDLDDGVRKTSKAKTEKRSALDDYKRAREQREAGKSRIDPRRDQRDDRSASYASDRDADGESEVEWAEPSSEYKRDEPPADLRDFNRVHVGRSNFAKVCFYPSFENAVKGCFARVSIGPDRATGQNVYRMAQIKGRWRAITQVPDTILTLIQASPRANLTNSQLQMEGSSPLTSMLWSPTEVPRDHGRSSPAPTANSQTPNSIATSPRSTKTIFVRHLASSSTANSTISTLC